MVMIISIIIPNYNGAELLIKNLPVVIDAVNDYKNGKVEIIIPDDASTDNSEEVIKEFITKNKDKNIIIKTISNKDVKLRGFAKNVNRGVKISTGDILILLNTDVAPREDFLKYLLPHFKDEKVFAVGCMDESLEGDKKVLRGRGIGKWEKGFLIHSRGEVDKNNTLWASAGSSAFSKKIWDELGGLEELYNPYYWEDIDLSYRALKSGYKVLFEKRSIVVHEHEKGAIKRSANQSEITKIAYRNQFIFVWLNITDFGLLTSHIIWLLYHLLTSLLRKDWNFYKGFLIANGRINEVVINRKKYIKLFKRSDKDVLSKLL